MSGVGHSMNVPRQRFKAAGPVCEKEHSLNFVHRCGITTSTEDDQLAATD